MVITILWVHGIFQYLKGGMGPFKKMFKMATTILVSYFPIFMLEGY